MLVPVDSDEVDVDEVLERVMDEHREESSLPKATKPPVMSFDEQLAVFLKLFPDGFGGETFQTTYGEAADGKRSLSKASKAMKQVSADLSPTECFDAVIGVWRSSAIVTPRKLTALEGLKGEDTVLLGEALHGLHPRRHPLRPALRHLARGDAEAHGRLRVALGDRRAQPGQAPEAGGDPAAGPAAPGGHRASDPHPECPHAGGLPTGTSGDARHPRQARGGRAEAQEPARRVRVLRGAVG